jgi:integrase/recombinase XerD
VASLSAAAASVTLLSLVGPRQFYRAVIALWLGHESVETTQIYLDADLALKEQVLAKTKPIKGKAGRYRPDDDLLAFLKGL